ncbi:flagellar hook assembly protein FlgD [Candidatus Neomarinimicrobiota bacterium]
MADAILATGSSQILPGSTQSNRSTINHDEFMTLLIAQLENQDPLAPMQSHEMAAQLAQFGSLESLNNIDQQLGESLDVDMVMTQAINNTMAANLIGREVTAVGDSAVLNDGDATLHFKLEDPASNVNITIYDESGQAVRIIRRTDLSDGEQIIEWNGTDDSGRLLSDGVYHFGIAAIDAEGNAVNAVTTASGTITGVSYETGMAVLLVGDLEFPIGNVLSIRTSEVQR